VKKTLLTGIVALFLATGAAPLVSSANAADMWVEASVDRSRSLGILIKGDIASGDYTKFKKIANRLPYGTVVIMTSRGGLLVDGLNIGTTIRARGFRTVAYDYCMSVCAMMWLAGIDRSTPSDTSIGFHGAGYENGEPSIAGNALTGAYLANLGFSYKMIGALINVGPKEMNWLSYEWAKALGIRVIRAGPCRDATTYQIVPCGWEGE
jgi:hypothetical protein